MLLNSGEYMLKEKLHTFFKEKQYFVIFLVSIGGFFLRVMPAFTGALWGDEAISFDIASHTSFTDLLFSQGNYRDFVHPPLYYLFLKVILLFNQSFIFLRASSLIFYPLTFFVVFFLAKKIEKFVNPILILLLFAVHPHFVEMSFQVRMYPMVIFFSVSSIYFFISNLKQANHFHPYLAGIFLALAFCTDYSAVWLLVGFCLFGVKAFFYKKWPECLSVVKIVLIFLVLSSYQLSKFLPKIVNHQLIAGSLPDVSSPSYFINELLKTFGFYPQKITLSVVVMLAITGLIFVKLVKENKNKFFTFFTILSAGPITLAIVYSVLLSPLLLARNQILSAFAFILLLGFRSKVYSKNYIFLFITLICYFCANSAIRSDFLNGENVDDIITFTKVGTNHHTFFLEKEVDDLSFLPLYIYYFEVENISKSHYSRMISPTKEAIIASLNRFTSMVVYSQECEWDANCSKMLELYRQECLPQRCIMRKL